MQRRSAHYCGIGDTLPETLKKFSSPLWTLNPATRPFLAELIRVAGYCGIGGALPKEMERDAESVLIDGEEAVRGPRFGALATVLNQELEQRLEY